MGSSITHNNDLYMDDIDMEDVAITPETWTSPLPPGIWDMDMEGKTSSSPPGPLLTSFEWQHTEHIAYTSPLFGLGLFPRSHSPVSKVGIPAEPDNTWPTACTSPAIMSPAPTHGLLHAPTSNSPAPLSSPTLLRAPRLAPRELLQSRNSSPVPTHSPLMMRSPPPSPTPNLVPPIEGTRPPVPRHFSALGLDFSAVPTSTRQPPSPPASLSEGQGRRRPRTPALDDDDCDESDIRGRSRLRMSDTNSRARLKPKRAPRATVQRATSDYTELNSRVHVWRGAVADAAATPYCAGDSSFPDDHWAEVLASTLCRDRADSESHVAALVDPWAARIGRSRGRSIDMPRSFATRTTSRR